MTRASIAVTMPSVVGRCNIAAIAFRVHNRARQINIADVSRMVLTLPMRLALSIAVALTAALLLLTAVNMGQYERLLAAQIEARFRLVTEDVRHRIETALTLGISMPTMDSIAQALEAAKARDSAILSIEVFDAEGTTLFSTDASFIGDLIADGWASAWRADNANGQGWAVSDHEAGVVGGSVRDSLGRTVGGIALRHDPGLLNAGLWRGWLWLGALGVGVVVLVWALALGAAAWLLAPLRGGLSRLGDALDRDDVLNVADPHLPLPSELVQQARGRIAECLTALDSARAQIRRLDEEG